MTNFTIEAHDASGTRVAWREHSLAFAVAVALHIGLGAALLVLPSGAPMPPAAAKVITTQLVALPPAPAVAQPPAPVAPAHEVIRPTPPSPAPSPAPQVEPPTLARADMALKRLKQERLEEERRAERARQRIREEKHRREQVEEADRERLHQESLAHASRLAADREAAALHAAEEAANRQYLPIAKEAPDYPARALGRRIEGECTVSYTVNVKGQVEAPQVVGSCHPLFIKPSLDAARTFRYRPKIVDGRPVAVTDVKNTFSYRIKTP